MSTFLIGVFVLVALGFLMAPDTRPAAARRPRSEGTASGGDAGYAYGDSSDCGGGGDGGGGGD